MYSDGSSGTWKYEPPKEKAIKIKVTKGEDSTDYKQNSNVEESKHDEGDINIATGIERAQREEAIECNQKDEEIIDQKDEMIDKIVNSGNNLNDLGPII